MVALPASARKDGAADATPATPDVDNADVQMAEYRRLQHKIKALAQKNAWDGVERAYLELLATGVLPEFEDYMWGAHSARSIGDVTSTKRRLQRCNRIREEREVIEWLAQIEDQYGVVTLHGDPGKVELQPEQLPFDPIQAKSIEFAQQQITATGTFDGLLPAGNYVFGPFELQVRPHVTGETIDVRSGGYMRTLERAEAKEAKKKK